MDRLKRNIIAIIIISLLSPIVHAQSYGVSLSYTLVATDPENMRGGQVMFIYDPERFKWRNFNIYFDGGYSYFYVTNYHHHRSLSILSAAPVIRYRFKQRGPIKPFLDLSVGVSYLSHTRLEEHNLGMHFAFQDRIGVGIVIGKQDQLSLGLSIIHYSNADLCEHNRGISVPVMLNAQYKFA